MGQHMKDIVGENNLNILKDVYPWQLQELGPYALSNFSKFNKIKLGQEMPKSQKEWNVFWNNIYNFDSNEIGASAYKKFINPIIKSRNDFIKANNTEALSKQQEALWKLFNGTGY